MEWLDVNEWASSLQFACVNYLDELTADLTYPLMGDPFPIDNN
jgi:hypothetical protein